MRPRNTARLARRLFALPILAALLFAGLSAQAAPPPLRDWGMEALNHIQTTLWMPERGLYADETKAGQSPGKPAFMWGCGVQLAALAAAARLDRATWLPHLKDYNTHLDSYWIEADGVSGYNVLPSPSPPDRYYDDNAWVALAQIELFELTRDTKDLRRATQTFQFVMDGEDNQLGGGIYWREKERTSKNTCVNAPAACAALRLFQTTHDPKYLAIARRLYAWTNAHLQDKDGLFFDNIKKDGTVEPTRWSYNAALMLRANALFFAVTGDQKYIKEAERIARAAETKWIRPETGAIADTAAFAHLLIEAFLYLYDQNHDSHWLQIARSALVFLHEKGHGPDGFYPENWSATQTESQEKITLLQQASAARAFLNAARYDQP